VWRIGVPAVDVLLFTYVVGHVICDNEMIKRLRTC